MQFPPPRLEQGVVDAFLNQGMAEQVVSAFRAHEIMGDQPCTGIAAIAGQVAQSLQAKALPKDGGGLQGLLVRLLQPVHTRQHDTLHRTGHGIIGRFLRATQQLFQK